jgi:hypothetical protein
MALDNLEVTEHNERVKASKRKPGASKAGRKSRKVGP